MYTGSMILCTEPPWIAIANHLFLMKSITAVFQNEGSSKCNYMILKIRVPWPVCSPRNNSLDLVLLFLQKCCNEESAPCAQTTANGTPVTGQSGPAGPLSAPDLQLDWVSDSSDDDVQVLGEENNGVCNFLCHTCILFAKSTVFAY